jgi:hypothetical protein
MSVARLVLRFARVRCVQVMVGLAWLLLSSPRADATPRPLMASDVFGLDLQHGLVLGSSRLIGMGGAAVGIADGSAAVVANPAAVAARATNSLRTFDWDVHLDLINANSGDAGNTGVLASDQTQGTVGGIVQIGPFGLGLESVQVVLNPKTGGELRLAEYDVTFGRSFFDQQWVVAAGLRWLQFFELGRDFSQVSAEGMAVNTGIAYRPQGRSFRFGGMVGLPMTTATQSFPSPLGRNMMPAMTPFVPPQRAAMPTRIAGGVAWRLGPTPWNARVNRPYLDERALVLAADVVVDGTAPAGVSMGAYAGRMFDRSGGDPSVSLHLGAEYECVPGWVRLRAGSYWEPSRIDGRDGRLHGTGGVEVHVLNVGFEQLSYRLRVAVALDASASYQNFGFSLGLWH